MIDVQPPQPADRRTRVVAASVGGALGAIILILAVWWVGAADAAWDRISAAEESVAQAQDALDADGPSAALPPLDVAVEAASAARTAALAPPVVVGALAGGPDGWGTDVVRAVSAANDLVTAASGVARSYEEAAGGATGDSGLFVDGRVDLDRLDETVARVEQARDLAARGTATVGRLGTWFPGVASVQRAKREALDQAEALEGALDDAVPLLQRLPDALGAEGQRRYLVALLNPAELRATGGAPLTVAVIAADDGRVSIPISGTFSELRPEDELHTWDRVAQQPFARLPDRPDKFANSNNHPDFPTSAQDMMRSWAAYGLPPVDGVIALDMTAVEAMLRATGPVDSPFGPITADNVVQRLLIDAYADFGNEGRETRRALNQQLLETVLDKLTSGKDLLSVTRQILTTAEGRHVQVYVDDPALQAAVTRSGLDGGLHPEVGQDRIAAYTTNTTGSKLDVFQARAIDQVVRLKADGGADVVRNVIVRNDAPPFDPGSAAGTPNPEDLGDGRYYEERDARNQFFVYLPEAGTVTGTGGTWQVNPRVWDDGVGGRLIRAFGTVNQGAEAIVRVDYSLPAGTFGSGGAITYRALVEPQAVWRNPVVKITVVPPPGWRMTTEGSTPDGWTLQPDSSAVLEIPLTSRFDAAVSAVR
ncbi:MAG: DUF4012 domain-containing protein [Candidatus Nanopelagicales bacterium]